MNLYCVNKINYNDNLKYVELYEKITKKKVTEIGRGFLCLQNLDYIQNEITKVINGTLKNMGIPNQKIDRQSDREMILLMIEFCHEMLELKSKTTLLNQTSVYDKVPIPASWMFSDPGDSYNPHFYQTKKNNTNDYLTRHLPDKYKRKDNCTNPEIYETIRLNDKNIPIKIRVRYLSDRFLEFIIPKVWYEIKNKIKYEYFNWDPQGCFVDYPVMEDDYNQTKRTKDLSFQRYFNGKEDKFFSPFPDDSLKYGDYPISDRKFSSKEDYNCVIARTLDKDIVNPQVTMGEIDILFKRYNK